MLRCRDVGADFPQVQAALSSQDVTYTARVRFQAARLVKCHYEQQKAHTVLVGRDIA